MRVRCYRPCGGLYWGQVWNDTMLGWDTVTPACFTEFGCSFRLFLWGLQYVVRVVYV